MKAAGSARHPFGPYVTEVALIAVLMPMVIIIVLSIVEAIGTDLKVGASKDPPWSFHVRAVDGALAANDLSGADRALRQAHVTALASRQWEALLAVGDAALRVDRASVARTGTLPLARQAYLAALLRARAEGSLNGVLRVTEAFAGLGDREVAAQALRIARAMAEHASDPSALARVRAIEDRLPEAGLAKGELKME